ncbi:MAG: hypothetical protein HGA33_05920 [Candidatus Moranbacteria bacterium]|nr:hypothetical protein [Candidatus Moranbacteria bacterium]
MNRTLNNLALLSFERKARKLGKNIHVANLMDQGFSEEHLIRKGETLIIWSVENGFHSIPTENDCELVSLVSFPEKYNDDEIHHFGILNEQKTRLYIYRCYDRIHSQGTAYIYGLRYFAEAYKEESLDNNEMSYITSLNGRSCCG